MPEHTFRIWLAFAVSDVDHTSLKGRCLVPGHTCHLVADSLYHTLGVVDGRSGHQLQIVGAGKGAGTGNVPCRVAVVWVMALITGVVIVTVIRVGLMSPEAHVGAVFNGFLARTRTHRRKQHNDKWVAIWFAFSIPSSATVLTSKPIQVAIRSAFGIPSSASFLGTAVSHTMVIAA